MDATPWSASGSGASVTGEGGNNIHRDREGFEVAAGEKGGGGRGGGG